MSRAFKYNKKEKKKTKAGMKLPLFCPKCKTPIPESIYDREDYGIDYQCPMCGTLCFEDLKKLLSMNRVI